MKSATFTVTAFSPTGTVITIPTSTGTSGGVADGQTATTSSSGSGTGAPTPSPTSDGIRIACSLYAVVLLFVLQVFR